PPAARCRGLLADGPDADAHFDQALALHAEAGRRCARTSEPRRRSGPAPSARSCTRSRWARRWPGWAARSSRSATRTSTSARSTSSRPSTSRCGRSSGIGYVLGPTVGSLLAPSGPPDVLLERVIDLSGYVLLIATLLFRPEGQLHRRRRPRVPCCLRGP